MTSREQFERDIIFYHVDVNREDFIKARIKALIENNDGDNYHANLLNEFVSFGTDCWLAAEAQFTPAAYKQIFQVERHGVKSVEHSYNDTQIMQSDVTLFQKASSD